MWTVRTKLIHSLAATAANGHDSRVWLDLFPGGETYLTQKKGHRHYALTEAERAKNRNTSRVRAKVEHPFLVLKAPLRLHQDPLPGLGQRMPTGCSWPAD